MSIKEYLNTKLSIPLVASPMFILSTPKLVIECCKSGIIGSFPAKNQRTLEGLEIWLDEITKTLKHSNMRDNSNVAPFGVNLIVHKSNKLLKEELNLCKKYKVPIVITSLGAVNELVDEVNNYGGFVFHDVISLRHSKKAIDANVDGIIAVTSGAGGHTGSINPFGLINEIKSVYDGMIILSGSLSNGSDIAAAQTMGADLAYMGTRFIATKECFSNENYKKMIINSKSSDIVLTKNLTGVNANFLSESLLEAKIDLSKTFDFKNVDINKELDEALDSKIQELKPWRDIWSAGHGVGSINDIPRTKDLVLKLKKEYLLASKKQYERSKHYQ